MLQLTVHEIRDLWNQIMEVVAERYSYLTEESMKPIAGRPATENELLGLERHWGFRLPASYRTFLSLHNGVKKFVHRTPLLSTEEICSSDGDWDVVDELDPELTKTVFAGSTSSDLFLCFDWRQDYRDGELEVVIFNVEGDESRHDSFADFLKSYLEGLRAGIEREKADRQDLQ